MGDFAGPFVTEVAAQKLWCPFAASRAVSYGQYLTAFIIGSEKAPRITCVASNCMAWRTDRPRPENFQPGETPPLGKCGLVP